MSSSRKRFPDEVKEEEKKRRKVTEPHGGHYGLRNQGATCYLNSVLQVLFMTTEIHDRLNTKSKITDEELRNLFEELKKATCGTKKITDILEIKNVRQQRDAAECLEMILRKVSPQASEAFEGQLTYTTKCSKSHSIIEETNPFWILPLSLKDTDDSTYSVEKGFEGIFQLKMFSGDNMVYCNECNMKTEATTGCEMVKYPQILTLLLKRFDFDYSTMSYVKSHRCVDVPHTLQRKNNRYRLYGMVNHMGGLAGGHYTATILSKEDKTWYEFNDDHVSKVEEQPFSQNRTYSSSTAYLLVYRASSVGDKGRERQDVDEQREQKRKREADHKENRRLEQNQENRRPMKKAVKKEAVSSQVQRESLILDIKEEDALPHPELHTRYPSKQRPVDHTTEARKQRLHIEEASSMRNKGRERQDVVEQREQKRKREADERENRHPEQNPESRRSMKKAVRKEAVSLQVQQESLILDIREEDTLPHPKQRPVDHTTAETRKQRLQIDEGANCLQPCRNPIGIKRKALLISLIVFIALIIVIIPVLVTTLNKS